MAVNRRQFLGAVGGGCAAALATGCAGGEHSHTTADTAAADPNASPSVSGDDPEPVEHAPDGSGLPGGPPLVVSTWPFGREANAAALAAFARPGSHALDACEAGVRVTEADPEISSVGYGGIPNADGLVQLDSCIMRGDTLDCGGVAALSGFLHPVSVARRVMERTRHVLLAGNGAAAFARSEGFVEQDMLSPAAAERWERWKREQQQKTALEPWEVDRDPEIDHDTIGMIAMQDGRLAMAVTTSGLGFKLPGRVGDSPIVGAGGYCDDDVGAAVSTGVGEEVIRSCGSFAIVELMRQGASPGAAIAEVLRRIRRTTSGRSSTNYGGKPAVAFLAVDREGRVGAFTLNAGFRYALSRGGAPTEVMESPKLS